jgi:hypothetical protein
MSSVATETTTIGGTPASFRVGALTDTIREILSHPSGIELAKARINKQRENLCLERAKRPGCGVSLIYVPLQQHGIRRVYLEGELEDCHLSGRSDKLIL